MVNKYKKNNKSVIITLVLIIIVFAIIIIIIFLINKNKTQKNIYNANHNYDEINSKILKEEEEEEIVSFEMIPEDNGANIKCNRTMEMKILLNERNGKPYRYILCKEGNRISGVKTCINGAKSYYMPDNGEKICYKPCPPGYKSSFAQDLQNPPTYARCVDENSCPIIKCPKGYKNVNVGTDIVKCECADGYSLVTGRTDKFNNTCAIDCKNGKHVVHNDELICKPIIEIDCNKYGLTADEEHNGCAMKPDLNVGGENIECPYKFRKKIKIKDKEFVVCETLGDINNNYSDVDRCQSGSAPYNLGKNYKIDVYKGDDQLKTCFKQCPLDFDIKFVAKYDQYDKDYNNLPKCIVKNNTDDQYIYK